MQARAIDVSVVMPVFDGEATVAAALDSVLRHADAAVEILCVDDGSRDRSAAVVAAIAADDPRVVPIRLARNGGVGAARNAALDRARGRYVCFLDADDALSPRALDRLLAVARGTGADIVMGHVLYLEAGPELSPDALHVPVAAPEVTCLRDSVWLQSLSTHQGGNLYRRALLEDHGLRFAADLGIGEDQLFQAGALVHAARVAIVDDTVYFYHHYASTSATRRAPTLKSLRDDLEWQRRTMALFAAHGFERAARDFLGDWSYSIDNYWRGIPGSLPVDEARAFFADFRALLGGSGVPPWHRGTPPAHKTVLERLLAGDDAGVLEALARLTTPSADVAES